MRAVTDGLAEIEPIPPAPPSLAEAQEAAKAAMQDWIDALLAPFTKGVAATEIASWGEKARAARAHLAGTPSPMIVAEATVTGEAPDDLAALIVATADRYERIIAMVTGLRRTTRAAIIAATDPAQLPAILDAAKAQATTMAKAEGIT